MEIKADGCWGCIIFILALVGLLFLLGLLT